MADEDFDETLLTDKLSKLNSSQQSIESVSRWCISQRKKSNEVVETWEKLFKSAEPQQQVLFLYLSNDILQNSRRKGSEFVNEFWKVLPAALKGVYDGGNENCRKVASRLVNIWEERKVFGSRGQNLKNELLGKSSSPSPANNVKNVNPIKVVKRDATSLRIKLAVGGLPEKILTAMQLVQDVVANEEVALNKCHDAVSCVQELEKDVVNASSQGNLQVSDVFDNIQKHENMIQQCISELEKSQEIRVKLVSQLREALHDQESKLEQIRSELFVAHSQTEQAANIRLQLTSSLTVINQPISESPTFPIAPPPTTITTLPAPTAHSLPSFTDSTTDEESKKAAAAAVAAKLAASTSSAQMLTSILSSLVAEEAASMSSGLKRPKLDPPAPALSIPQANQSQSLFMPPPPPPLATSANSNQVLPPNMMAYGFGAVAFARPGHLPPQQTQLQPPVSGGYFRPVGVGFYGQTHKPPTTPPMHRQ